MTPQEFISKLASPELTEKQYDALAKKAPKRYTRGTTTPMQGAANATAATGSTVLGAGTMALGHKHLDKGNKAMLGGLTGANLVSNLAGTKRTKSENRQERKANVGAMMGLVGGLAAGHRMPAKGQAQYWRNLQVGAGLGAAGGALIGHGKRLPNHDEARAALKNRKKSGQTKTAEEKQETAAERKQRIRSTAKRYGAAAALAGGVKGAAGGLKQEAMRLATEQTLSGLKKGTKKVTSTQLKGAAKRILRHTAVNAVTYGAVGAAYGGGRAARDKDRNYYTGEREKLAGRKASTLLGALGTGGSLAAGAGANDGKGLQTSAGSLAGREAGRKAGRALFAHGHGKSKSSALVGDILGGAAGGAAGAYLTHGKNRTKEQEQERKDKIIKDQAQRLPTHLLAQGPGGQAKMLRYMRENQERLAKKACIDPQVDSILDNLEKEAFLGAAVKATKGFLTSKTVRKPLLGLARKVGPGGRSMVRDAVSSATKNPIRAAAGAGAALGAVRGAVKNPGTNPDGTQKSRLSAIAKNTAGGAALGAGAGYGANKLR